MPITTRVRGLSLSRDFTTIKQRITGLVRRRGSLVKRYARIPKDVKTYNGISDAHHDSCESELFDGGFYEWMLEWAQESAMKSEDMLAKHDQRGTETEVYNAEEYCTYVGKELVVIEAGVKAHEIVVNWSMKDGKMHA